MPRANQICSMPGCLDPPVRNGRCAVHQFERYGQPWERATPYGRAIHASLRRAVLTRDPTCAVCRRKRSTEVDHVIPRFLGGDDSIDNLQGLCRRCHATKSSAEGAQAKRMKKLAEARKAMAK